MRPPNKTILLKVVILGDGGVGKSCLMNRFVSNQFDENSFHTIGVEFLNKDIEVDGEKYTLQVCIVICYTDTRYINLLRFRSGTQLAKKDFEPYEHHSIVVLIFVYYLMLSTIVIVSKDWFSGVKSFLNMLILKMTIFRLSLLEIR